MALRGSFENLDRGRIEEMMDDTKFAYIHGVGLWSLWKEYLILTGRF